jgi:hypothetical protein
MGFVSDTPSATVIQQMERLQAYARTLDAHRQWLDQIGEKRRTRRFAQQLRDSDETAICEACLREWLEGQGCEVKPAEDMNTGGPDFLVNDAYYVECTCMITGAVTNRTGLEDHPADGARYYRPLTRRFFSACDRKAEQCGTREDRPCLLAICTLHFTAGAVCFDPLKLEWILTDQPTIAQRFDPSTGQAFGPVQQRTALYSSPFIRPAEEGEQPGLKATRQTISGLLLCPFGALDPPVRGVLNVQAFRPFRPEWLPLVPFCRLKGGYETGVLGTEWVQGDTIVNPRY